MRPCFSLQHSPLIYFEVTRKSRGNQELVLVKREEDKGAIMVDFQEGYGQEQPILLGIPLQAKCSVPKCIAGALDELLWVLWGRQGTC